MNIQIDLEHLNLLMFTFLYQLENVISKLRKTTINN